MTAPRDVSTTDRPSAWGRIRVARVSSCSAAPAASARSARPDGQPGRVEPGALLHDQAAEVRVAADLGPQLRPRHDVRRPCPRRASPSTAAVEAGGVRRAPTRARGGRCARTRRRSRSCTGARRARRPRSSRGRAPRRARRRAAGGARSDDCLNPGWQKPPLRVEAPQPIRSASSRTTLAPELGRATGRGQAHQAPADHSDVDRVGEVAAAPVGRVGHRRLPERARVHVPQLGDRGHRVRG